MVHVRAASWECHHRGHRRCLGENSAEAQPMRLPRRRVATGSRVWGGRLIVTCGAHVGLSAGGAGAALQRATRTGGRQAGGQVERQKAGNCNEAGNGRQAGVVYRTA